MIPQFLKDELAAMPTEPPDRKPAKGEPEVSEAYYHECNWYALAFSIAGFFIVMPILAIVLIVVFNYHPS